MESRINALKLYLEGVGFRGIKRLRPELTEQVSTVEWDEIWHFIPKKRHNAGYGWHGIENANAAVACSEAGEIVKPLNSFIAR